MKKIKTNFFRLKLRIMACKAILTGNFILIHNIKETVINGAKARELSLLRRTDYTMESDFLTMKGAILNYFPVTEIEKRHHNE